LASEDATGGRAPQTVPRRDWAHVIRARLAGTRPQHRVEEWRVPGLSAQESQRFRQYFPANPRPAAVLVPLVERPQLSVLLTQRATQLRNHAGQISFGHELLILRRAAHAARQQQSRVLGIGRSALAALPALPGRGHGTDSPAL